MSRAICKPMTVHYFRVEWLCYSKILLMTSTAGELISIKTKRKNHGLNLPPLFLFTVAQVQFYTKWRKNVVVINKSPHLSFMS